jgi:hypothetical protein
MLPPIRLNETVDFDSCLTEMLCSDRSINVPPLVFRHLPAVTVPDTKLQYMDLSNLALLQSRVTKQTLHMKHKDAPHNGQSV